MNTKVVASLVAVCALGITAWLMTSPAPDQNQSISPESASVDGTGATPAPQAEQPVIPVQAYEKAKPGQLPTMPKVDQLGYGQQLTKVNGLIADYENALSDPSIKAETRQKLKAAIAEYNELALPAILAQLELEQRNQ